MNNNGLPRYHCIEILPIVELYSYMRLEAIARKQDEDDVHEAMRRQQGYTEWSMYVCG